jgi:hypothetical protein
VRIAQGVYARPKPNRYSGTSLPATEEVAYAIAKRTGEQLAPHGAELARRFGMSTQMPVQASFYTTGRTRRIEAIHGCIYFEHAPEALMKHADSPAGQAALVLHYLGRTHATKEMAAQLLERIPAGERQRLKQSQELPVWMWNLLSHSKPVRHAQ